MRSDMTPAEVISHMLETGKRRLKSQMPWLSRLPDGIGSILDVGAGAGAHSAYFKERGYRPVALDYEPTQFQFHDEIEFLATNLMEIEEGRLFDAIFMSHVLEHMPDTMTAMTKIRAMLNPNGYLFIIVPPFDGRTGNDHCHIGWTCAQLAMWFVASGFDCTGATFMEMGQHVCGWGRKRDFSPTGFEIMRLKEHLPQPWAEACYIEDNDDRLPDVVFADPLKIVKRTLSATLPIVGLEVAEALYLDFKPGTWAEVTVDVGVPLDLTREPLQFASVIKHDCNLLRFMISSDTAGWDCFVEAHVRTTAGISIATINEADCIVRTGRAVDFTAIRRISVGGFGDGPVRMWIGHEGKALSAAK
ncbi:bifunctional 2-polyprenyl-6-hydroxyphenol methylase/3-demethylubiquinol 3-O-methyltransferase UbiG [Sphingobium sp. CFD-2]|uniref:class I SAM-dependent methyltransferase n=1 Tax=Sphingobium sp. CFD-2 TaxID=2878542 RepID=UPI00214BDADD|nr:class I SAM-dependent methyltransferase [Sphingobium sp. CFD-2]